MNCLIICSLIVLIATLKSGVLSKGYAKIPFRKYEFLRNQHEQRRHVLDSENLRRYGKKERVQSRDTLLYDPVFKNHTALADFLNNYDDEKGRDFEMEINAPQRRSRVSSNATCTGLCKTSICPWTVEIDTDTNRVPENIQYARCLSDKCHFPGISPWSIYRLVMETRCETFRKDIYVSINGKGKWIENWPVACICASAKTKKHTFGASLKKKQINAKTNLVVQPLLKDNVIADKESQTASKRGMQQRLNANAFVKVIENVNYGIEKKRKLINT